MTALARHDEYFSREQIDTIKSVVCPGITDNELKLFSEVCRQTKLSPFAKQIYVTKRPTWDPDTKTKIPKMTIQTGIDGFRLIAERTGKYRGQTQFQWCGLDGVWKDVWLSPKPPAAARAGVIRSDFSEPLYRTARWDAYVQVKQGGEPNSMWAKMGPEQLAKCAEALALRTAFPQELAGLYTDDEMAQADNEAPRPADVRATVIEQPKPMAVAPKQLQPDAEQPAEGEWGPRHERVWGLYANSSVVDQPLTSVPTEKLVAYIGRLEATVKGPASSKTPEAAANAKRASIDAVPYLNAARAELVERRKMEAEMAGANAETGELPDQEVGAPFLADPSDDPAGDHAS
jgi:phage recombination protein Bet